MAGGDPRCILSVSELVSEECRALINASRMQTICLTNRQTSEISCAVQLPLEQVQSLGSHIIRPHFLEKGKKQLLGGEGRDLSLVIFLLFQREKIKAA